MSVGNPTYKSTRSRITGRIPLSLKERSFRFSPQLQTRNALTVKPFKVFKGGPGGALSPPRGRMGFQGDIVTPFGQAAARKVERQALRKLAFNLIRQKAFGIVGELVSPIVYGLHNRIVEPEGFPGWDNIAAAFTSNAGAPWPGIEPGDLTINGFDNGPWSSVVHNLVDLNDGDIFGFRYWGHYHAATPLPGGAPADDWDTQVVSSPLPNTASRTTPRTRYRRLTDLAPQLQTQVWSPNRNIAITISTDNRDPFNIELDVPRIRDRGDKAKPANAFVWLVLKTFANAGGEIKEWTDILAAASGYIKGSMMLPDELRDTGKETQAKLYWLFVVTGVNSIDWTKLAVLIVENEIEDRIYGALGQLSKSAGQSLGLTVGPQTGLIM